MNSRASARYWECWHQQPQRIQNRARKNFALWKENPRHPSLQFKEVKPRLWSARVGLEYRVLAAFDGTTYVWFWIGPHDEYDRFVRS